MNYDYFYGAQAESYSFIRVPRLLMTGGEFKELSTDAKLLYSLLLDRMGLSMRNGWLDEAGRVYIYYTVEEIQDNLNCGHGKACKLLAELDTVKGIGLIERKKQGQGKPTKIYVKQFVERNSNPQPGQPKNEDQHGRNMDGHTPENRKSGPRENGVQGVSKPDGNYINNIYTENSYTDSSIYPSESSETETEVLIDEVREQIDYPLLAMSYMVVDLIGINIKVSNENTNRLKEVAKTEKLNPEKIRGVLEGRYPPPKVVESPKPIETARAPAHTSTPSMAPARIPKSPDVPVPPKADNAVTFPAAVEKMPELPQTEVHKIPAAKIPEPQDKENSYVTKIVLTGDRLRKYFPDVSMTPREIEDSVYDALEERRQRQEKAKQKAEIFKDKKAPVR